MTFEFAVPYSLEGVNRQVRVTVVARDLVAAMVSAQHNVGFVRLLLDEGAVVEPEVALHLLLAPHFGEIKKRQS